MKSNEPGDTYQVSRHLNPYGPGTRSSNMPVTTADGGRGNAFAKEPRMEVMDAETSRQRGQSSLMMMVGGAVLVMALVGVTVAIS